jgi:hypothetical protein
VVEPILTTSAPHEEDGDMGFIDSIKEALGGDSDDESPTPPATAPVQARHVDRDAPAERMEDSEQVTGGKHRA